MGAGFTLPILAHWFGATAWRPSFIVWSLPVLAVLVLWLAVAPKGGALPTAGRHPVVGNPPSRVAGRPFWLVGLHFGLLSGCCSLIYFNMNAWTAPYDTALGRPGAIPLSLALLNAAQLPVCLAITPVAQRLTGRRLPFVISGLFCLVAIGGWAWTPIGLQPLWACVFGGSTVAVLVLGIALPPYFASPANVARLVGAALGVSYLLSFVGQLVGGRLWEHQRAAHLRVSSRRRRLSLARSARAPAARSQPARCG